MERVRRSVAEARRGARDCVREQWARAKTFVRETKIVVQSPVTLAFVALTVVVFASTLGGNAFVHNFAALPAGQGRGGSLLRPGFWVRLLVYPLAHNSVSHLIGNLSLILLLAPLVEARLGPRAFAGLLLLTTAVGGLANAVLSSRGIIGASGIVFMLITLTPLAHKASSDDAPPVVVVGSPLSATRLAGGLGFGSGGDDGDRRPAAAGQAAALAANHLPATFVLLFVLYVGKELALMLFADDGVSHLGHLVGGLCGAIVGLLLRSAEYHRAHSAGFLHRLLGLFQAKAAGLQKRL